MTDYDALLVVSFGGPEGPEDVMPFLRNVTRGRGVPDSRLEEVAEHYHHFGGKSPINDQNRALVASLEERLTSDGPDLPVYLGNRNWHPFLADTLREIAEAGHRRVLAFVTVAYSSWSGCRQYREALAGARAEAGVDVEIDKVRVFYNHPGFVEAQVDRVDAALRELPDHVRSGATLLFTTHSIPLRMARHCEYQAQTYEASRLVASRVGSTHPWEVVYCSRSGPPHVPWLEPDVGDRIRELAKQGAAAVVVVPIGFVSDHMEVIFDLDVEAAEEAEEAGLPFVRAGTVGTHPRFVEGIRELVLERIEPRAPRLTLGTRPASHDVCPVDCCLVPGQDAAPAVAGQAGASR